MIKVYQKGNFQKLTKYMVELKKTPEKIRLMLDYYGRRGVLALEQATPVDSGLTAASWYYVVGVGKEKASLTFYNTNVNRGVPIAIILQMGHGTGTGGWVEGRDYINPALKPVFDDLAKAVWKEVTQL